MSSHAASSGSSPNVGSATTGSTVQQANVMTRNLILGIPKEGLVADSPEAADLQAAEAFLNDIQQEILAYDIANAKAMEAYTAKWWSKVPYFGRHAKRALEREAATAAATEKAKQTNTATATCADSSASPHGSIGATSAIPSGSSGLRVTAEEAAAALQVGNGTYLHKQTSQTSRGCKVERTSAIDTAQLSQFTQANVKTGTAVPPPPVNSWLFRRQHPGWVPLMQRWWVPWLCIGSIVLIWTPDVWKLRCLYTCDYQYALLRQAIHKAYWRATMSPEDYAALMADIEAERPTKVSTASCPFE